MCFFQVSAAKSPLTSQGERTSGTSSRKPFFQLEPSILRVTECVNRRDEKNAFPVEKRSGYVRARPLFLKKKREKWAGGSQNAGRFFPMALPAEKTGEAAFYVKKGTGKIGRRENSTRGKQRAGKQKADSFFPIVLRAEKTGRRLFMYKKGRRGIPFG